MIKLTKKFIGKTGLGPRLVIHPNWVSNGHWLVQRHLLTARDQELTQTDKTAAAAYDLVEASLLTDEHIAKVLTKCEGAVAYVSDGWQRYNALYYTRQEGKTTHVKALATHYAKALDLEMQMYSVVDPEAPCCDREGDPRIICMPVVGMADLPAWWRDIIEATSE